MQSRDWLYLTDNFPNALRFHFQDSFQPTNPSGPYIELNANSLDCNNAACFCSGALSHWSLSLFNPAAFPLDIIEICGSERVCLVIPIEANNVGNFSFPRQISDLSPL